jgi:hypothetical protein
MGESFAVPDQGCNRAEQHHTQRRATNEFEWGPPEECQRHDFTDAGRRPDGTFRRISVGVLQPVVAVARTRAGYYADPSRTRASAASSSGSIVR